MAEWKRKYRHDPKAKVFIIKGGGYPTMKKALFERGWVENEDKYSPCFHFKWTVKLKDARSTELTDKQIVNHFTRTTAITNKMGLTHSLQNLIWHKAVDIDSFYPRCYEAHDTDDWLDFEVDFKVTKAQAILKTYVREMRSTYAAEGISQSVSVKQDILKVAMTVCQRHTIDFDDMLDDKKA